MPNTIDIYDQKLVLDYLISHTFPETEFIDDTIDSLGPHAFNNQNLIQKIQLDNVSSLNTYRSIYDCKNLKTLLLPKLNNYGYQSILGCNNLETIDLGLVTNYYWSIFNSAYYLKTVFLKNSQNIATRESGYYNWNEIWGNTIFYVPSNLVNNYKTDTNWACVKKRIFSLDEYPIQLNQESISDSWSEIIAKINNNTENYKVGDTKFLNINGENILCKIIGKDTDTIPGTSDKAKTTWIAYTTFFGQSQWNTTNNPIPTYKNSYIRNYINNTILPMFPQELINNIKNVDKSSFNGISDDISSEKLFLFSLRELGFSGSNIETLGPQYFQSSGERSLGKIINNNYSSYPYWTRSRYTTNYLCYMSGAGGITAVPSATSSQYILLGFCI